MLKGATGMSLSNQCPLSVRKLALFIASAIAGAPAYALTPEDIGIELRNKASGTVSVSINATNPVRTEYRYMVRNEPTSQRAIDSFNVQLNVPFDTTGLRAPKGWTSRGCCVVDNKREGSTGIRTTGWIYDADGALVQPGASQDGFVFEASSATIPSIKRYFIESFTELDTPIGEPGDENEEKVITNLVDFFNNSTSGLTLGPDPLPVAIDVPALIDRLIALKHQSASLGWLGNAKFVAKLDKRLDQAKAALARDKKKLARTRLSQFVHELTKAHKDHDDDRRDKHEDGRGKDNDDHKDKKFVNDEAFQLLKINADFIIAKLPAKAKNKDEEDECSRAEGEKDNDHDDSGKKKDKGSDGGKEHGR